ncbi:MULTISPECIES: radical SAM protein [unclassified Alcanivorax]|uniref:radical SAM protein n=4 Tax=Alcanivorax TaxID=59753 RepID=UPI0009ED39BD|nr:MAG: radical SAM protein [Alcanivorax sp.]
MSEPGSKTRIIQMHPENETSQYLTGGRAPVPTNLFFLITSECNLSCKHCHMWLNKDSPHSLTLAEKIKVVEGFAKLNPHGNVVLSGGEVMLKIEDFFALTKSAKSLGLNVIAVSNSSLIAPSLYKRFVVEGPDILYISLDSHVDTIHDYIRGTPGAWNKVVRVIKGLVEKKKESGSSNFKIFTSTVLFEENIYTLENMLAFIKSLGVDGASVQVLSRTVMNKSPSGADPFFDKSFFKDRELASRVLDEVISGFSDDGFLVNLGEYEWMKEYILKGPDYETSDQVCGSAEKNIFVDHDGRYSLCANMDAVEGVGKIGTVRDISVERFWFSVQAERARGLMNQCRKHCGMYACHRKD